MANDARTIPDRLIELAEQWSSPYRWQSLLEHHNQLKQDRAAIVETTEQLLRIAGYTPPRPSGEDPDDFATQTSKYALLRSAKDDPILKGLRENEKQNERLTFTLVSELKELELLVRQFTPDLLGNLSGYVHTDATTQDEHVRGMRTLLGNLLDRRKAANEIANQDCTKNKPGRPNTPEEIEKRVSELKAQGGVWKDITKKLNEEFPQPGKPWTQNAVRHILRKK